MSYIYEALLRAERERQSRKPESAAPPSAPAGSVGTASAVELGTAPVPPQDFDLASAPIPQHEWRPLLSSFPSLAKHGRPLEQFRSLRSHFYQARREAPLKTILVSSGMPSEGKSFVTANLAMTLARNSNNRILLIDGDLRRPSLHHLLGTTNEIGLADYLMATAELHAVMQRCSGTNSGDEHAMHEVGDVTFIPAGTAYTNASELITNQRIKELISVASPSFDWILIDSPPALVFADAVDLARAADAVLLVVRGSQTTFEVAQRAKTSFANSRILGVVLNDIKNPPRRESYYDDYYGKTDVEEAPSEPSVQDEE